MRSLMHVRGLSTSLPCSSTSRLWFGSISSGDSSKFRFPTLMREQFDEEKIVGLLVCCSRKYVPSIDTHDDSHREHTNKSHHQASHTGTGFYVVRCYHLRPREIGYIFSFIFLSQRVKVTM